MGKQKRDARATVSQRALVARINRRLAHSDKKLIATKSMRDFPTLGDFYVIDVNLNAVVDKHVDIEALGRHKSLGALKPWERLEEAAK